MSVEQRHAINNYYIIAVQLCANAITDNSLWLNVHLLETVHNAEMYVPVKIIVRNIASAEYWPRECGVQFCE